MRMLVVLFVAVLSSAQAWGACAPGKLARIVYRDATPGIERDSFPGQPKTLYRLGDKYARLEEAPDSQHGIHGLSITAEPDMWLINLATNRGQHMVDPSQPYIIHVQVFGGPEDPELLKGFEFGCELAFMKERKANPERAVIGRFTLDNYKVTEGLDTINLSVIAGTERPLFVSHFKSGTLQTMYQYIQYDLGLKPQPRLFVPPSGVKIEEAKR